MECGLISENHQKFIHSNENYIELIAEKKKFQSMIFVNLLLNHA